jgi:hypothetical protein
MINIETVKKIERNYQNEILIRDKIIFNLKKEIKQLNSDNKILCSINS